MMFALFAIASLLVVVGHGAEFPGVHIDCRKLLPAGWIVADINAHSVPYGIEQAPQESFGLGITVEGPKKTKGPKGERVSESLTIYIMPKAFTPIAPQPPGPPLAPARNLGFTAEGFPVYAKRWSEIESWPSWEKAIHDFLMKREPNKITGANHEQR